MSSFFEKVVAAADEANERDIIEDIKNSIMGEAVCGYYQLVMKCPVDNFDETTRKYFSQQGFKIDITEEQITISWGRDAQQL